MPARDLNDVVTLFICVTCRTAAGSDDQPGRQLFDSLTARLKDDDNSLIGVKAVECLSVCSRPCTVAFTGRHRWTYVVGDIPLSLPDDQIVAAMRLYQAAADGVIPWRQRPDWFRKAVVARIPPADPYRR